MLSAIQIKKNLFTKIDIHCNPLCVKKPVQEEYEVAIGLSDPEHEIQTDTWKLGLDVRFCSANKSNPSRYEGHVTLQGAFEVSKEIDPKTIKDLVKYNGLSLLLGSAREMILLVTSRSTRGPYVLSAFDARMFIEPSSNDEVKRVSREI